MTLSYDFKTGVLVIEGHRYGCPNDDIALSMIQDEFKKAEQVSEETVKEKTFILHWLHGATDKVYGSSIDDAFMRGGFGGGAIRALDWYEEVLS